ncbi:protease inhibitor I42 family protein [Pseudomonas sp. GD03860]|uniref:protease inhibitor I42 family protein n=1 Tax=Pseudomonas TaxID=286 RepID=UPI00236337C0|nr:MULTISPECIES: protease inhibitor I42 family protein [Pseudomonas]MDD2057753.1 protease inhibitor I42 family protein [Pseudomonas putida]MDH0635964.1 protease inhibitor I42 family protein [Pseudomonas sp. GD03860]
MTAARLLLPLGLALLAACAQQPRHSVALDDQADCPLPLKTGQLLTLTLPSNPSTGYRWLVQNPASSILRSLGPEVYSHPEDAGVVGSAGQSVWRYQAQAAGEGHLILVYQQPWAPEVRPVKTFDCAITVE